MNPLIYIVDDDSNIREIIKKYLLSEQYRVHEFSDGKNMLSSIKNEKPDLIVLDIMMPDMDGYDICKELRKDNNVPIIFVSAKDEEFDKILGLELGGDDYLSKPFSPRELIVRIKTILRRIQSREVPESEEQNTSLGDISVIVDQRKVLCNGQELDLTSKEFDFLNFLIKNNNKVYKREQLLNLIWGYDFYGDIRSIDDLVKRLRKKLISAGSAVEIKTVWGYGYKIVG